jgi:hypothetical protein
VSLGLDTHGTLAELLQKLFHDCGVSAEKVGDRIVARLTLGPGSHAGATQRGSREPVA